MDAQVGRVVRCARPTGAGRQHDHRLHQRPRLSHGRARPVAEDEPVRGKRPRAAVDRRAGHVGKRRGVAKSPVSQIDLFPTLAELCGVKTPAERARAEPGADAEGSQRRRPRLGHHASRARRRSSSPGRPSRRRRRQSLLRLQPAHAALALHGMGRRPEGPRAVRPRRRPPRDHQPGRPTGPRPKPLRNFPSNSRPPPNRRFPPQVRPPNCNPASGHPT